MLYDIAYTLGMPVYKLENEMPYEEYVKWMHYFSKRPQGWKEDQRTYMIMRAFGVKESAESIFPTLAAVKKGSLSEPDKALPKGQFLKRMLDATKSSGSEWIPPWLKDKQNDHS